jgi:hypothetical protein
VAEGEDPEFKPQYHQKKKETEMAEIFLLLLVCFLFLSQGLSM